MKKNMGKADSVIRTLIAIILVALYATDTVTGIMGTLLLVISGIFLLTSLVLFCPVYRIFGWKTCSEEKKT
jgi:hypothetical protein